MADTSPSLEEWRQLYQTAIAVKELAPWEWMNELDLFGVQDPETGEIGFVSVMGQIKEHYGIAVYLGVRGLDGFWELLEEESAALPEQLLQIPTLQASFEDREFMDARDLQTIKRLGLKFRGRNAWPRFRSIHPGFLPWHLEAPEVRFLNVVLDQLQDVAQRLRENPELLTPSSDQVEEYLVRVPRREGGELTWKDNITRPLAYKPPPIPVSIEADLMQALGQLPVTADEFDLDLFVLPVPVQEKAERPYFPYALLMMDRGSELIISNEVLAPTPSLEEMWAKVPSIVANCFLELGALPKEIAVNTDLLFDLLEPLAEALDLRVDYISEDSKLDQIKERLIRPLMAAQQ